MLNRLKQAAGLAGIALFAMSAPAMAALEVDGLAVEESDQYGEYLVTSQGRSVYMFEADSEGESTCYDDCADAWPPLMPSNGAVEAMEGVDEDMVDTIEREDGTEQVTYNGQPLYVFVRDTEAGDTSGHKVEGFGGEWYLVNAEGEKVSDSGSADEGDDNRAVGSDPQAGEPSTSEEATDDADGAEGMDDGAANDAVGSDAEAGEPDASEEATDGVNGANDGDATSDAVGSDAEAGEPEASEEATNGDDS